MEIKTTETQSSQRKKKKSISVFPSVSSVPQWLNERNSFLGASVVRRPGEDAVPPGFKAGPSDPREGTILSGPGDKPQRTKWK